jgi:hypothetical protein
MQDSWKSHISEDKPLSDWPEVQTRDAVTAGGQPFMNDTFAICLD